MTIMSSFLNYEEISEQINKSLTDRIFYFIKAESGVGKTYVLMRYCQENNNTLYLQQHLLPFKSPKALLQDMLLLIDSTLSIKGTTLELFERLAYFLKAKNIKRLIIDDIQSFTSFSSIELFELLLTLSEKSDIKFICAGTEIPELSFKIKRRSHIQNPAV